MEKREKLTAQEISAYRSVERRANKKPDIIINMTPHPINILDKENNEIARLESAGQIRIDSYVCRDYDPINDIPTCRTFFRDPVGLPKYEAGTYYIVSQLVKSRQPDRRDLLVPADIVRDKSGNIIGCRSLGR